MKRSICLIIAILLTLSAMSQEDNLKQLENLENKTVTGSDSLHKTITGTHHKKDTVAIEVGDEIFSVREVGDETRIRLGKKEYRVVEDDNGVKVFRSSSSRSHKPPKDRFKGHIGGFELGLDNLMTSSWSTSLEPKDSYLNLNTAKSYTFSFSLPCLNVGFTRHFGMATTLGINFNKYRFDGNNSIIKGENGVIEPLYPTQGITYSKSKLATTYATLPVILETQIPLSNPRRTINIGAGVIGAAKLGSHTKVVYQDDGKQRTKNKDDFSLNTFRCGATARIGYEFFQIYGTRYFTPMFVKGKGPELYPFEVGIAFTFNN
jgi:hypothetical protein